MSAIDIRDLLLVLFEPAARRIAQPWNGKTEQRIEIQRFDERRDRLGRRRRAG